MLAFRVATVIYSAEGQETVIHNFDDVAAASSLIAGAPFLNSRTDTARAFRFVFDNLINIPDVTTVGRRAGVDLRLVVVTDGSPTGELWCFSSSRIAQPCSLLPSTMCARARMLTRMRRSLVAYILTAHSLACFGRLCDSEPVQQPWWHGHFQQRGGSVCRGSDNSCAPGCFGVADG